MLAQNLQSIQSAAGLGNVPQDTGTLIGNIFNYVFYISGFLLLIYLIMGGFQIMFSRGDPKATAMGWSKVTSALIGFLIVLFAYTISKILGEVFGISIFGQIFK